ncbi:hypothetical protein CAC42_6389 [Sphaceloma murrayae]|uniref:Uncharacterized protein n=1 Tax=Sphaceloma murrayae TaxID=2082308 RepID=A0A2K1QMS5_9PEZI|nr:hypothetical protein CAC42_6389 [Sphaceloma murrayae]
MSHYHQNENQPHPSFAKPPQALQQPYPSPARQPLTSLAANIVSPRRAATAAAAGYHAHRKSQSYTSSYPQQQVHQEPSLISPQQPQHHNSQLSVHPPGEARGHPGQRRAHVSSSRSPLKRSSISILEDGKGLTYLKRRKLSLGDADSPPASGPRQGLYAEVPQPVPSAPHDAPLSSSNHDSSSTTPSTRQKRNDVRAKRAISQAARELAEQSSEDESEDSAGESQRSFNSLINYDPSSQTSVVTPRIGLRTPKIGAWGPNSQSGGREGRHQYLSAGQGQGQGRGGAAPEERREAKCPRSLALRLRLRVAVYKVLTGQTHVAFGRLRLFSRPEGMGTTVGIEGLLESTRRDKGDDGQGAMVVSGRSDRRARRDDGMGTIPEARESSGDETIEGDM